jgi:preprotein translocase subunit SecY
MRALVIFISVIIYLFVLVYIESELVKIEVRMEELKNRVIALRNRKKQLESELIDIANLANIEASAKMMGFVFPDDDDVLGVVE